MKKVKVDNSGVAAANAAMARAQEAATNLSRNFGADLKTNNIAKVVAGDGSEGGGGTGTNPLIQRLRKNRGAGLASQLGVNV
jgi:hypothetical protein